jgi:hypothetical protein
MSGLCLCFPQSGDACRNSAHFRSRSKRVRFVLSSPLPLQKASWTERRCPFWRPRASTAFSRVIPAWKRLQIGKGLKMDSTVLPLQRAGSNTTKKESDCCYFYLENNKKINVCFISALTYYKRQDLYVCTHHLSAYNYRMTVYILMRPSLLVKVFLQVKF